jgi:hypothetical protein
MNLEDKEYFRSFASVMTLNALIKESSMDFDDQAITELAVSLADRLIEALEPAEGIVSIRKRKYVKKP